MVRNFSLWTCFALWACLSLRAVPSLAVEDGEIVVEDGIKYRITKQVVDRTVWDTRPETREQTVYHEKYITEMKEMPRSYYQPITEYQWIQVWERPLNPFVAPYIAYRQVPVVRWELKSDTVRYPVTKREVTPEKQQQQVSVPVQRSAKEIVTRKTPIGIASGDDTQVARRDRRASESREDDDERPARTRSFRTNSAPE